MIERAVILTTFLCILAVSPLEAQSTPGEPATEPSSVPGNAPDPNARSWRERYELGPGDVLNFSLYGRPELDRNGIRIAPDGTVSYLQAQGIRLTGMTIDEARLVLEQQLTSHFKYPRIIITPEEIGSKRFTILGKVMKKGIYTLERPMTLVEAVAHAGGMETGLFEQNTIELADLDRSFLSRDGQPLEIDFRRLFLESDMSENVEIEPGDFIYIASTITNEYYVFGEVNTPGVQGLTPGATIATAFARRRGFTPNAWLDRVLVVRGRFDKPEAHVVSLADILAAEAPDFPLLPGDIIYVADHPWTEAKEILKLATTAFISSATTSWINLNVDPILGDGEDGSSP